LPTVDREKLSYTANRILAIFCTVAGLDTFLQEYIDIIQTTNELSFNLVIL